MTRMRKPANVARTADRNTKIHLYICKSFKCLLVIFLPQCTWGRLVSSEWQLNWLHVSQAIIRKQISYIKELHTCPSPPSWNYQNTAYYSKTISVAYRGIDVEWLDSVSLTTLINVSIGSGGSGCVSRIRQSQYGTLDMSWYNIMWCYMLSTLTNDRINNPQMTLLLQERRTPVR